MVATVAVPLHLLDDILRLLDYLDLERRGGRYDDKLHFHR